MKKRITLLVVLITIVTKSFGQVTFSASPGTSLNSASFGYKINDKIIPHIGIQYLYGSFSLKTDKNTSDKVSAHVFMPTIGVKYFALQKNKIKGYLDLDITKPFIGGKISGTDSSDANQDYKKVLDNIHMWGGQVGFGVEYFFDKNFSIGGEYGFRYFHLKYKDDNNSNSNNESDDDESVSNYGFIISPTYSKISLNYYF